MNVKNLIASAVLISMTPLAMAAGLENVYVAVDLGRSTYKNACKDIPNMFYTTCTDSVGGYRFSAGYQINDNVAVEVSRFNAGKITASGFGVTDSIETKEWQFVGIGLLPVGNDFSLFAKLGFAHWNVDAINGAPTAPPDRSSTGTDVLMGFGGKFDFNSKFAVRTQYEFHSAGETLSTGRGDINFLSAGLMYKF